MKSIDIIIYDIVPFDIVDDNMSNDDDHIKVLSNVKNNNDMIIYHESESNNEVIDARISYSSYMVIYNELFNHIKDNNQLSTYVVGLMLETK